MIYESLSLAHGGGITPLLDKIEQSTREVSVIIGLGGTGIECIRSIKKMVYSRIKPDDSFIGTYSHIRFIGVDTDPSAKNATSLQQCSLTDSEFFCIANRNIGKSLRNTFMLNRREELA